MGLKERLSSKVAPPSEAGCWEFTGFTHPQWGYGRIANDVSEKPMVLQAHRVMWEVCFGEIPTDLLVCHKCDNPPCVNPSHLFLGTPADNMTDMSAKGRGRTGEQSGESNPMAKLTGKQVAAIRGDNRLHREIAADFGVARQTISRIKSGQRW